MVFTINKNMPMKISCPVCSNDDLKKEIIKDKDSALFICNECSTSFIILTYGANIKEQ
jgi:uncharacterized Zn finger protein